MAKVYYPLIIRGGYGFYNFGDDALMVAVNAIAQVCFPQEDIAFLCKQSSYLLKLLPEANFISATDRDKITADVVIYGGGTQFYSFPGTIGKNQGLLLSTLLPKNSRLYRFLRLAYRWVKPRPKYEVDDASFTMAIGIGLGPFVENSSQLGSTMELFKKMSFVAVRDSASLQLCIDWGIASASLECDICCWEPFYSKIMEPRKAASEIHRIAMIVRDWTHDKKGISYKHSLFQVYEELVANGFDVTFCLFKGNHEEGWIQFFRSKGLRYIFWDPMQSSLSSFCTDLSIYDLFISARYHGAVFATLLERPVICIDIEPKLALASHELESSDLLWKSPFDKQQCLDLVRRVNSCYSDYVFRSIRTKKRLASVAGGMVGKFRDAVSILLKKEESKCR